MQPGYYYFPYGEDISRRVFFTIGRINSNYVYTYRTYQNRPGYFSPTSTRAIQSLLLFPATKFSISTCPSPTSHPELFI